MKILNRAIIICVLVMSLFFVGCKKDEHKEHNHDFQLLNVNKEATCTEDGENLLICGICQEQKVEVVKATGHKPQEATCISFETCANCNEVLGSELGGHSYITEVMREVTCDVNGLYKNICIYCGFSEIKYVNPLGHSYSDWKIEIPSTCEEDGLRTKECATCHNVIDEVIKKSHTFGEWNVIQNATCSSNGLREHFCEICNEVEREELDKVDHVYGEWEVAIDATCTVDGTEHRKCSNCSSLEARSIEKIDHDFDEWVVVNDATCTVYGIQEHKCKMCKNVYQELVEKLEHNFLAEADKLVCEHCHLEEENLKAIVEKVKGIELVTDSMEGLILPTEVDGINLTWKSYTPSVVLDDGTLYASKQAQAAQMVASFTYLEQNIDVKFDVTIPVVDVAKITYCWNAYYSLKVPEVTATNVRFLTKDYGGVCSVVEYVSSNDSVINGSGTVFQKAYDQEATITCYLKVGKVINGYSRKVTVKGYTELQCIDRVAEWLPDVMEQLRKGDIDILPITHEVFGTNISWFCMDSGIIAGEGVFVKPLTPQTIKLEATIIAGEYNRTLTFTVENVGGGITVEEQLVQWMKGQIPSRIRGTRNFVLANDSFDYQIRTNDRGVLNLIDGSYPEVDRSMLIDTTKTTWVNRFWGSGYLHTDIKPELTQAVLDKMMYTGYQKPNEDNILWITIHESGMPRAGNNALLLAQVQMDSALGLRNRQASWNYQVDENKIYQSFEDNIICWHASDGSATPGNGNTSSIGIEMCINEDGNYDGAMHLDAKLVAMLITKYNLKLQNIKRHFDFAPDKKQCPYYMIEVGRWNEFLNLVDKEYTAMSFLKGAKVSWSVTTDDNSNTQDVLNRYFIKGGSTLWFSKQVTEEVVLHITMTVEKDGVTYTHSNDLTLYPNV